jgi:hypothetical protein
MKTKNVFDNLPDFEVHVEGKFPIIYRKRGNELTDACPFCGKHHRHGIVEGHQTTHCTDTYKRMKAIPAPDRCTLSDGTYALREHGYILREY